MKKGRFDRNHSIIGESNRLEWGESYVKKKHHGKKPEGKDRAPCYFFNSSHHLT